MCFEEAITTFFVLEQGDLSVCKKHFKVLTDMLLKKTLNDNYKRLLTGLLNSLNEHYTKVPLVQAPTKKFENNGIRSGLKIAIREIEKRLAELIKK